MFLYASPPSLKAHTKPQHGTPCFGRIKIDVGVAYGSEVRLVEQLLLEAMAEQSEILEQPAPQVFFQDFGDSSLDFSVRGWMDQPWKIMAIQSQIRTSIDTKFRANGIQIPFPQRDLHVIGEVQQTELQGP